MPVELSPAYRVLARGPAPTAVELARAAALGASAQYVALAAEGTDLELMHESGIDVRIWHPTWVVEANTLYRVRHYLPHHIAIGDAYGDFLLEGPGGLSAVGPGDLDPESVRRVAPDLSSLLHGLLGGLREGGGADDPDGMG